MYHLLSDFLWTVLNILYYFFLVETVEIKTDSDDKEEEKFVETLIGIWISTLNEMVHAVDELTSESEINQLYESVVDFVRNNKEEIENVHLRNLLKYLEKKIQSYAQLQRRHRMKILGKFLEFILMLKRDYGVLVECVKGSILLSLTFSSRIGHERYEEDLENGKIGKLIKELFLYPSFLERFGLKAENLIISLNGRKLTQQTGMLQL